MYENPKNIKEPPTNSRQSLTLEKCIEHHRKPKQKRAKEAICPPQKKTSKNKTKASGAPQWAPLKPRSPTLPRRTHPRGSALPSVSPWRPCASESPDLRLSQIPKPSAPAALPDRQKIPKTKTCQLPKEPLPLKLKTEIQKKNKCIATKKKNYSYASQMKSHHTPLVARLPGMRKMGEPGTSAEVPTLFTVLRKANGLGSFV